ncbi:hypothetical protein CONCODRAFT_12436 [Conidiobolus coronatus NRRL 28638]|uniref:Galactose oxidase n=1 Tax=Conidiobolus coronatus (strain ATCC 28846 / CBS 209.66 / NRRL 28638) TaxID=796925 RepID=A0A137NT04_CONC2|nr:hypothetical protein CONCODRAFT_12436 [Conidiobolus coronatus NRRL 28638]|eukprot:KXN65866.1 hypothetical protein CONCODRAFT_12436 [Conidiobolus coronatus NRRL 28638]
MLLLLLCYFLTAFSEWVYLTSATIRDNKLYTIVKGNELGGVKCNVYELKDGPIIDIVNSAKTFELINNLNGFDLMFIDGLNNSNDSYNKLWVRTELINEIKQFENSPYRNWVGYINIEDMSLITDSSIIKFPTHENFPIFRYTVNNINNGDRSALYITGGVLYSKNDDKYSIGNSFFKYNLTTREWVDMAYLANEKLKPLVSHKSMIIDNRYLVVLGGYREKSKEEIERLSNSESYTNYKDAIHYYSLYNLTVFDTVTNSWESFSIKPNVFDTSIVALVFDYFLATVYNNLIIVIGGIVSEGGSNQSDRNSYLGILDYNSKTWDWIQIDSTNGDKFKVSVESDLLLYNNQLIITSENLPIQVYDMHSQSLKSTLGLSEASNIKENDRIIPIYAIVLIAIACTALLIAFIYYFYRKNNKNSRFKNDKSAFNENIREVWSYPDIDNTNKIISWD